jgi:hypothetical protein
MTIIASDPEVMKEIRFKSMMADCRHFEKNAATVLWRAENEQALLKSFIHKEFDAIMANFDTKIVKLKKKSKVVICNGVVI